MDHEQDFAFVDIQQINAHILVQMRYASESNMLHRRLYIQGKCYLRRGVALKLDSAQKILEGIGMGLKLFDGYRPNSVQTKWLQLLPDERRLAFPDISSKHNRGASVDLTLVDAQGEELLMPTPIDAISERARRTFCDLPKEAIYNRAVLENVLAEQGFLPYPQAWWHFDDADWKHYPVEDIPLEDMELQS